MTTLEGKAAIITGGAGGVGSVFGRELARRGASVVLADLNGEGAKAHAARLADQGLPVIGGPPRCDRSGVGRRRGGAGHGGVRRRRHPGELRRPHGRDPVLRAHQLPDRVVGPRHGCERQRSTGLHPGRRPGHAEAATGPCPPGRSETNCGRPSPSRPTPKERPRIWSARWCCSCPTPACGSPARPSASTAAGSCACERRRQW